MVLVTYVKWSPAESCAFGCYFGSHLLPQTQAEPIIMLALRRSELDLQFPLFVFRVMLYC